MSEILWEETLRGGQTWSQILDPGMAIGLTDTEGGANVAALFYNATDPGERYNMPDTLKAQHIARLTKGFVIYSDMGRILCSMTEDTVGWHDPIGGMLNAAQVRAKYGEKSYQEHRNDWTQNTRDSVMLELAKYGLGPRDITPPLNLFSKVQVDEAGAMHYVPGNSHHGSYVELRAEMKLLVILNANHHPMEPGTVYSPKPVKLKLKRVAAAAPDDPCRLSRPENGRGFIITGRYRQ
jgi:urea carboxylase-associated protein 2